MTLRQYLRAMKKFWWVIAIPMVLGSLAGVYRVSQVEPVYQATTTFFVRTVGADTSNGQFAADQFAQRRVNSYVALLSTDRLARAVVERSGLELSPAEVSGMISASGDVNTVLLNATVTSSSEELATAVANAVAIEFVLLVDAVENTGTDGAAVNLELVSGPSVGEVPTKPLLTVGVLGAVGFALGLALALALELRDTSVRSDDQLDHLGAGPIIGRIPFDRRAKDAPLITTAEAGSLQAESYRQLRTNLQFFDVEQPLQVLVVSSPLPGEGKSTTSANLAITMAAAGRKVLVVEADFRRPKLADYFGIERAVGLTDVLAGRVAIEDVLQPWGTDGLVVLPSGHFPPNPSELLGSSAMQNLVTWFRSQFDIVIIDTPPLLPVTDGAVMATKADGAVLVVRQGKSTRHQVELALRALDTVGARLVGSVLTFASSGRGSGYSRYGYESGTAPASPPPASPDAPAPRVPELQPLPSIKDMETSGSEARPRRNGGRTAAAPRTPDAASEPPPWGARS